jgi:TPP-dependent pyruvate/acetoin dehydrogenase alpha subunit
LDDPITRLRAQLTREGKLTNEQFDRLDKQAKETVLDAVKFAEQSPQPPLDKLYDYTYANGVTEAGVPDASKSRNAGSPANSKESVAGAAAATENKA